MIFYVQIFCIGLVAGTMNALAGGGSFVTLPGLIAFGVPSLNANATSTTALLPNALVSAYAYRTNFQGFSGVSMAALTLASLCGGVLGALLLLWTPQKIFDGLLPFLLLLGAFAFLFGQRAGAWLRARVTVGPNFLLACQFVLGVYGGYFGGAVGIMMLAAWSLLTTAHLNAMQMTRNLLNLAMNATASIIFVAGGLVAWDVALALGAGALLSGYGAAVFASRLDPKKARKLVSLLIVSVTAAFFWKTYF